MDLVAQPNDKTPSLNVNIGLPTESPKSDIVKPEEIIIINNEILKDIRDDQEELADVIKMFKEMVINEGDATAASKEALVNLLKIKSETADKKTKVLDIMLRAFLKEKENLFPKYLAAYTNQHNEYKINTSAKRDLIKSNFTQPKETNEA